MNLAFVSGPRAPASHSDSPSDSAGAAFAGSGKYDPAWAGLVPRRTISLAPALADSPAVRGEALVKAVAALQPGDCLTLYDDGPDLRANDKRRVALALAVGPALEGLSAEVRAMLDPTRLLATVSIGLTAYMALLVAPDPVLTKGLALGATVLLWAYLGTELFELIRAYVQLHETAPEASTFAELREVGERFGRVIGPNSVRILVLVGTAAVGETASLVSRASGLPGYGQASRAAGFSSRLSVNSAMGASRLILSTHEGTLRAVLPLTALAMAAPKGGDSSHAGVNPSRQGRALPNGHRAFKSFEDFKAFMGSAGEGKQWHHIVEQRGVNVERFGPEAIHNTENVIKVDKAKHEAISAFYSSKSKQTGGMVVREWLRSRSYEQQRAFGLNILKQYGALP